MALNAEREYDSDVELKSNNGWTPKLRNDNDGSKRRNQECDSERQTEEWRRLWTPRLKMWWLRIPNEDAVMALNAETGNATLNVKLRSDDDGFESRNWEYNSERQTEEW